MSAEEEILVDVHSDADTLPFVLLQPGTHLPRTGPDFQVQATYRDVDWIVQSAQKSRILAVDFETRGGDYSNEIELIGVGLAWDSGSCYLHWADLFQSSRIRITNLLCSHRGLIAHNVYFDGGVARVRLSPKIIFYACTYALYAMLANESPERKWGLKAAQVELLGWTDSNEHELDQWLVENGYYIGNELNDESPEVLRQKYLEGRLRADKGEMWRAPTEILGKYCALDAEACYLLFDRILSPILGQFPDLEKFFLSDVMNHIQIHIEQKIHGIAVDRKGLEARREVLLAEISGLTDAFLSHPKTSPNIREIELAMCKEIEAKEPAKFKKDGGISKNWTNWKQRLTAATDGTNPAYRFNINSGNQLRELLYDRLGFLPRIYTEGGEPAVGHKAYKHMGDIGMILSDRADKVKELSYVDKYLELTSSRTTIHPSFRQPGTITGRGSSKEPNMQQIPKTKAMMSLFQARPGHVWVDLDFSALEPVVLTEFSQDENLLAIYGDSAPKNDIYLFVAASIPTYSDTVRKCGYDPLNPTPAGLAAAKAQCKSIRSICKTVVLACQYGAGVRKIMETLEQDNVFLSFEEVQAIHTGYWNLFAKAKDFARSLHFEWKRNGGYILNGMGRPMCVPEDYSKDLLNRFVQSTGHDILIKYVSILSKNLNAADIPWKPIIIDFHDATTVEVPELYAERTVKAFNESMRELNQLLGGSVQLRGTPTAGRNLADCKEPEA